MLATADKLYLWIGRHSTANEKKEATARAVKYLADNGMPNSTRVERVSEGNETAAFTSLFHLWHTPKMFRGNAAKVEEAPSVSAASSFVRWTRYDVVCLVHYTGPY